MISLRPVRFRDACEYIALNHRHHRPPQGWLFGIAAYEDDKMVGVACVGRPVARRLDDGLTCEVTRLCCDGTKNVCSMLYSACWRAAEAMGYQKIVTYILRSEPGISLRATGWTCEGEAGGGSWDKPGRRRIDKAPTEIKTRWVKTKPKKEAQCLTMRKLP